jgi:hypothetical protein
MSSTSTPSGTSALRTSRHRSVETKTLTSMSIVARGSA